MESILKDIIQGVSNNYGKRFFDVITQKLDQVIEADYTFIARLDRDAYVSRTVCLVADGEVVDNIEYSLEHTPCANVADDSVCMYPQDIVSLFPQDQLLIDMGIEGYIGTPLHDSNGQVMGLTVALYKQPIKNKELVETLFQVFSGRIAAEIERMEYSQSLEDKVAQRTRHLEDAILTLKNTQQRLIKQEKLASLGGVVAGVAHEINTPLGVAKTATSYHCDILNDIDASFKQDTLTASALKEYIEKAKEIDHSVLDNLERAINLIQSFKHAAVDRTDGEVRDIQLGEFIQNIMTSLGAELTRHHVTKSIQIDSGIELSTYGSSLSQVINNLVMNACVHAFEGIESPSITIQAQMDGETVVIDVMDNGVGVSAEVRENVFEPFVTSRRGKGSTGLGMNIVHNLVSSKLHGEIRLQQTDIGTCWQLRLPLNLAA